MNPNSEMYIYIHPPKGASSTSKISNTIKSTIGIKVLVILFVLPIVIQILSLFFFPDCRDSLIIWPVSIMAQQGR